MQTSEGFFSPKIDITENGKVIRKERHTGSYLRSFNVGNGLIETNIDGKFQNNLLELKIPKAQDIEYSTKRIEG